MAEAADDGTEVAASSGGGGRLGTGEPPGTGPQETAVTTRARRRGVRSTGRMRCGVRRRRPRAAGWEGNHELTAIGESSGRRGGLSSGSERTEINNSGGSAPLFAFGEQADTRRRTGWVGTGQERERRGGIGSDANLCSLHAASLVSIRPSERPYYQTQMKDAGRVLTVDLFGNHVFLKNYSFIILYFTMTLS